jgi:hypothetical protein
MAETGGWVRGVPAALGVEHGQRRAATIVTVVVLERSEYGWQLDLVGGIHIRLVERGSRVDFPGGLLARTPLLFGGRQVWRGQGALFTDAAVCGGGGTRHPARIVVVGVDSFFFTRKKYIIK